jgi:UrcA family protein
MRVKVADVNLSTEAGAQTALARIRFGAAQFCERDAGRQSLERTSVVNRCVAEMTRKGVDGLNAPLVTALLRREAPGQAPTQVASAR